MERKRTAAARSAEEAAEAEAKGEGRAEEEEELCSICYASPLDTTFLPCNHQVRVMACVCVACAPRSIRLAKDVCCSGRLISFPRKLTRREASKRSAHAARIDHTRHTAPYVLSSNRCCGVERGTEQIVGAFGVGGVSELPPLYQPTDA